MGVLNQDGIPIGNLPNPDRPPLKTAKNAWKTHVFATPHFGPPADLIREIRWL